MTGSGEIVGGTRKEGYRFCVDVHRLVEVLGAIENPTEMDDKRAKSAQREVTSPSESTDVSLDHQLEGGGLWGV